MNEGLLPLSDRLRINNIMQEYARLANVESLRTPLNARKRDRYLSAIQDQGGCTLRIVSLLMSDLKQ